MSVTQHKDLVIFFFQSFKICPSFNKIHSFEVTMFAYIKILYARHAQSLCRGCPSGRASWNLRARALRLSSSRKCPKIPLCTLHEAFSYTQYLGFRNKGQSTSPRCLPVQGRMCSPYNNPLLENPSIPQARECSDNITLLMSCVHGPCGRFKKKASGSQNPNASD